MSRRALGRLALALGVAGWAAGAGAQTAPAVDPLPDPLTLTHALSLLDETHPDLALRRATLARSEADVQAAEASTGFQAGLRARARWGQPHTDARVRDREDHALRAFVEKPLFDFGRSDLARRAARAAVEGEEWMLLEARQRRWLEIAEDYFRVLLADLRYARENEAMAIAFVRMERGRDRNELEQLSDVDRLALESVYQAARTKRFEAAAAQRAARARLAHALNRPGDLPSRLTMPRFADLDGARPEFEPLLDAALDGNPRLRALRARVESAREAMRAAEADTRPVITGEVEGGVNSRPSSAADYWRAGVLLEVPLFSGGRSDARIAHRRALLAGAAAELAREELHVRELLLEQWLSLETLAVARAAALVHTDYRDLYLDRSRALYEQEVRSDLGDAQVEISQARLDSAQAEFELVLSLARVRLLTGVDPVELTSALVRE